MFDLTTWLTTDHGGYWALLLLGVLFAASPLGRLAVEQGARLVEPLAENRGLALLIIGGLSLLVSASVSMVLGIPSPRIHDEFSNLLAADTFAHGRLSNPAHPLAEHFETIHVIQQPTYCSKYPPAQGLMMALGIVATGLPISGQWLATAIACAAVTWMLYAAVPARWAVLGGLLAVIHPQILAWSQGYLGSSIALAGGAMVVGAFFRILKQPCPADSLLLGIGVGLLANSRPYEGLLVSFPLAVILLLAIVHRGDLRPVALVRMVVPCFAVIALTALAMGYYNWRTTGSPLLSAYDLHEQRYNRTPHFVFQPLRPRLAYNHKELAEFHEQWAADQWRKQQTLEGWLDAAGKKMEALARGWFSPLLLAAPLVALPMVFRENRQLRPLVIPVLLFLIGMLPVTWLLRPHYTTPVGAIIFSMLIACMRQLYASRSALAQAVVRAACVACLVAGCYQVRVLYAAEIEGWQARRANVVQALLEEPGDHLVIVRYGSGHDVHQEWVYNAADIDGARIVWAREMDPQRNGALLDYFKGRRAWLLEVGEVIRINPYSPGAGP